MKKFIACVLFYAQTRAEEKSHKSNTRVARRVEKFTASVEQIKKLREVSQLGRYGIELPKAYKIYLEMMDIDDGGLLSKFFNGGTANIEDIIQIYNNLCESKPEALDTPYQIIFWCDWGGMVADRIIL